MSSEELTEKNFNLFAAMHYTNKRCLDIKEFMDDVARFRYLRASFKKYIDTGLIQERLVLNHIISLLNVFDTDATVSMCLFSIPREAWPALKPFLIYLNMITEIDPRTIDIDVDLKLVSKLQKI